MKVEFLVNTGLNDGRQILIQESEFRKAKDNEDEFYSFAFATDTLSSFYGWSGAFIDRRFYEKILNLLEKDGSVIITVVETRPRDFDFDVYVSNKGKIKRVDFQG